ncbi:hypothetical protein AB0I61_17380 [Polymorphospora rubra]|uniref:hypothetical protein n=1 Tax=Polymorphospora rubra TaxID=338584 RepID=UPI0033D465FD
MPIIAGPLGVKPGPGITLPGQRDAAQATWHAPDGTMWPLTNWSAGWWTLDEVSGLGAVPITLSTAPAPRGGARVQRITDEPRLITWPLHVWGNSHTEFLDRWRRVGHAFTQTSLLGPGILVISRPDGTAREIEAYYQDGWFDQPGAGHTYDDAVLTLFCEDGYFRDREPTRIVREYAVAGDFLDPYPSISSGQVLGDTVIQVGGQAMAWPDWTITGPASLITATNTTAGTGFVLNPDWDGDGPLLDGQTVRITTDPPTVRGPAGEIWTGALVRPGARLWGMLPGPNQVVLQIDGAGDGTRIELTYKRRWQTA